MIDSHDAAASGRLCVALAASCRGAASVLVGARLLTMCRLHTLMTFLAAGIDMFTSVRTRAAGRELVTAVECISEYRLKTGLRVLLFPDPSKPQVTVNITVLV